MKLANSLYPGSVKMYVPCQVRSLGGNGIRLQIVGLSPLKEYDLTVDQCIVTLVAEEEVNYANVGELNSSLYENSNKYYVPAQIRVLDGTQSVRLQIADAETGELRRETTFDAGSKDLIKGLNAITSTVGVEETPSTVGAPTPAMEETTATDSVVAELVAALESIKADANDLLNEQIRMLALAQVLVDRIQNL